MSPQSLKSSSPLARLVGVLSSLKLAIVLLVVLAAVLAVATILETKGGRAYAQWHVYQSRWFLGLLGLLAVNIFFAAAVRFPWKRHQVGFVITHGGLLVLLAGAVLTFTHGLEGQVTLNESQTAQTMTLPGRQQVRAAWVNRPDEAPYEFSFLPGPSSRPAGQALDVGTVDGIHVRVLQYHPQARACEEWVPDETGAGGPLVKYQVTTPDRGPSAEQVLVAQEIGDEQAGPVRVRLQRAASDAMLNAFLAPPTPAPGTKGVLLAFCGAGVKSIAVDENVGRKVPLDDRGTAVEIVAYHANARPDSHGQFRSINDNPQNPLLELRVHGPGLKEPVRQVASAHNPLLNLDLVYGQTCPVHFTYHHPSHDPAPAVEFLQSTDGKLHCRLLNDGKYLPLGEVRAGGNIPLPGDGSLAVADYLPHTRLNLTFDPAGEETETRGQNGPAAEVEVTADGTTQAVWLQGNNSLYNGRVIETAQGPLEVTFGPGERSLGFGLQLLKFERTTNPGGVGNATFASQVRVVDPAAGVSRTHEISMNHPLTYGGLTFYQSSFSEPSHGRASSTFSVASDPGRPLKYAGSLLVCLGIATMFYMRAYFFRQAPRLAGAPGEETSVRVVSVQVRVDQPQEAAAPREQLRAS